MLVTLAKTDRMMFHLLTLKGNRQSVCRSRVTHGPCPDRPSPPCLYKVCTRGSGQYPFPVHTLFLLYREVQQISNGLVVDLPLSTTPGFFPHPLVRDSRTLFTRYFHLCLVECSQNLRWRKHCSTVYRKDPFVWFTLVFPDTRVWGFQDFYPINDIEWTTVLDLVGLYSDKYHK